MRINKSVTPAPCVATVTKGLTKGSVTNANCFGFCLSPTPLRSFTFLYVPTPARIASGVDVCISERWLHVGAFVNGVGEHDLVPPPLLGVVQQFVGT